MIHHNNNTHTSFSLQLIHNTKLIQTLTNESTIPNSSVVSVELINTYTESPIDSYTMLQYTRNHTVVYKVVLIVPFFYISKI